jgi:hypothetical protein
LVVSVSSIACLTLGSTALACPPTVTLGGDQGLVAEVAPILAGRGISTSSGECPAIAVSLERRGNATLVSGGVGGDRREGREVTDARTAATVIESWVSDLDGPLLVHRSVADTELPDRVVAVSPSAEPPHALQIFTLAETGFASDRTTWFGFQTGACSMIGAACVGGRLRLGAVADGPSEWESVMDREAIDGLFTIDVPTSFGRLGLAPGGGIGLGFMRTYEDHLKPDTQHTIGLRAEGHLSLSYPVSRRFAVESNLSVELAQTVHTGTEPEPLPSDPHVLAHFGLGLRFRGP